MTLDGIAKLSSLSEWSIQHIKGIFEAETDEDSLRNIRATFADNVSGFVNGSPLNREGIERLVLTMRKDSLMGLKVDWKHLVEAPQDRSTNRVSRCLCPVNFDSMCAGWIVWWLLHYPRSAQAATGRDRSCRVRAT